MEVFVDEKDDYRLLNEFEAAEILHLSVRTLQGARVSGGGRRSSR